MVQLSGEIIYPDLIGIRKINVIPHIISHLIPVYILINRRYKDAFTEHELVLHGTAVRIVVLRILQKHGPYHRKTSIAISGIQVGCRCRTCINIWHQS